MFKYNIIQNPNPTNIYWPYSIYVPVSNTNVGLFSLATIWSFFKESVCWVRLIATPVIVCCHAIEGPLVGPVLENNTDASRQANKQTDTRTETDKQT